MIGACVGSPDIPCRRPLAESAVTVDVEGPGFADTAGHRRQQLVHLSYEWEVMTLASAVSDSRSAPSQRVAAVTCRRPCADRLQPAWIEARPHGGSK